eukprot:TRINITY_DN2958_c0_g1_i1.p1 TRINITY_DN2958_c0_g1~~TRINITY_DN2958_c0_g1_i1.p1  ORF type:complete len:884 (+),score=132.69 TRINITY_DN2958_c0_g1_i1:137-2653(+)
MDLCDDLGPTLAPTTADSVPTPSPTADSELSGGFKSIPSLPLAVLLSLFLPKHPSSLALLGFCSLGMQTVQGTSSFNRVATFPVCTQIDAKCNTDSETVAEIVTVTDDGMTLIYGDSANKSIGFVDITDPTSPVARGTLAMGGEVTSVAMTKNDLVLVAVDTSPNYTNPSGSLKVVNTKTKKIVRTMDLGGQPDAVAVSPDKNYAAIAIENQRDEDLGDGGLPQLPAGFVVVVDTSSADQTTWAKSDVSLAGLGSAVKEDSDPEPEFVSINSENHAVVTLQENNAIVIIDLATKKVVKAFTAGTVDLAAVDTDEEGQIKQNKQLAALPREPDGVTWIGNDYFATADEGDMDGGSRGFTIFNKTDGQVVYSSGHLLEHLSARLGHYPEERSKNKGNEPENVAYGEFGSRKLLFVNSERSNLVFVFDVADPAAPVYLQALPAGGVGPEGAIVIPNRQLLVVACEKDDRSAKFRSSIVLYQFQAAAAQYPTLVSGDRFDASPVPWAAISGLSASPSESDVLYAVEDSFFKSSRFFRIKTDEKPAKIVREIRLLDSKDVLASVAPYGNFTSSRRSALINADKTVNLDLEGIAVGNGEAWIASEGRGSANDSARPIESLNFLLRVDMDGVINAVVTLPDAVNDIQLRYGFEGVAKEGDHLVLAFQRAWGKEANPRLGIYNTVSRTWKFVFYPLDAPSSQNGGWVGLSDISSIGGGNFLVLERDNQGGPDASIKNIYQVALGDLDALTDGATITKTLLRDLLADLEAPNGAIYEKMEGMAVMANGNVWVCNDNDGVDDNSGETQLINLGKLVTVVEPSITCGQVRQAYKSQQCCGQPNKTFVQL